MKTKSDLILSITIMYLMDRGLSLSEAIDAVLGAGTYDKIVDDVYEALRSGGLK